jgi:RNA polymerase sigma-70 factor (ECF subfamily)
MDRELEKKLVEESRNNPEVFGKIFEEYYPAIFRYCLHRTANTEVSNDITSETFYKALNKLGSFKWTGVPFSAWLYRIAGNEIIDYFRHRKYEPGSYDDAEREFNLPDRADHQNIEKELIESQEKVEAAEKFIRAKEAIYRLPVKYQEVLVLRFLEDRKILEICDILGKGEGTVKSLISRGLGRLKKIFEEEKTQPSRETSVIFNAKSKGGN